MPTSGPHLVNAAVNDASVGATAWTNPGNVVADDGVYCAIGLPGSGISNYVKATLPAASRVPAGATIDGVTVEYEAAGTVGTARDSTVKLVVGGVITGNNLADLVNNWPVGTDTVLTRGGPTDTGGLAITPAQANAADIGVAISIQRIGGATPSSTGRIDFVRLTFHYTAAAAADPVPGGILGNARTMAAQTLAQLRRRMLPQPLLFQVPPDLAPEPSPVAVMRILSPVAAPFNYHLANHRSIRLAIAGAVPTEETPEPRPVEIMRPVGNLQTNIILLSQ